MPRSIPALLTNTLDPLQPVFLGAAVGEVAGVSQINLVAALPTGISFVLVGNAAVPVYVSK